VYAISGRPEPTFGKRSKAGAVPQFSRHDAEACLVVLRSVPLQFEPRQRWRRGLTPKRVRCNPAQFALRRLTCGWAVVVPA
jgi:hypothetical protein